MTPKEKAEELVNKFIETNGNRFFPKECALIVVDEIINTDMLIDEDTWVEKPSYLEYWEKVKQEINNL